MPDFFPPPACQNAGLPDSLTQAPVPKASVPKVWCQTYRSFRDLVDQDTLSEEKQAAAHLPEKAKALFVGRGPRGMKSYVLIIFKA